MWLKLCIDIWRDVFDWLPTSDRKQIAQKSNQINDHEFSDLLQKWLHEWAKNVCLGPIVVDYYGDEEKSAHLCDDSRLESIPLAEVPAMPDNVRNFTRISISYLDSTVLSFLQGMQPLFRGSVNFGVYHCEETGQRYEAARTALGHLIPLLNNGGIDDIQLHHSNMLFTIRDHFPAQLFGVKLLRLASARPAAELAELLLEWLVTRREDGQPRMLSLFASSIESWVLGLIERIRQQYVINANSGPANFLLICIGSFENIQESTVHNAGGTNEQLVVRKRGGGHSLLVGRCPSDVDGQQWVEEMDQEVSTLTRRLLPHHPEDRGQPKERPGQRMISIWEPELGPFEEAELEEEEKSEEEEEEDGQPGPSNVIRN